MQQSATKAVRSALTWLGVRTAHPTAFLIVIAYVAIWAFIEPETLDWHGFATIATWFMTLFIQRAEHRDTQALHAKLDEIVKALPAASNAVRDIDQEEPEEIEAQRAN